jgi:hypothetical protein
MPESTAAGHTPPPGATRALLRVNCRSHLACYRLPDVPSWIIGDRDYGLRCFPRADLGRGRTSCLDLQQPLAGEEPWTRLKEWRTVAIRRERTARSFLGILCLAATADWITI